jgi:hypothetical protein
MHQSCIVKGRNYWTLLLIGGKTDLKSWTNTCESIDLFPIFNPGEKKKVAPGKFEDVFSQWEPCASMKSARANFAIQVIQNKVYVFGGVASNSPQDKESWRPSLAQNLIECYSPTTNEWSEILIPNAPSLAAFSWCVTDDRLIILGGSDGNLLNSDLIEINFLAKTCEFK